MLILFITPRICSHTLLGVNANTIIYNYKHDFHHNFLFLVKYNCCVYSSYSIS